MIYYSLIKKECIHLKTYILFLSFYYLCSLALTLFNYYPDALSMAFVLNGNEDFDPFWAGFENFFIIYILTYALIKEDYNNNQFKFLQTLPVSHHQVFIAKIMTVTLIMISMSIAIFLLNFNFYVMSSTSLDPSFHLDFWISLLLLEILQTVVVMLFCAVLCVFKLFGLFITAFILMSYRFLFEQFPDIQLINFFNLLELTIHGEAIIFPVKLIIVQIIMAMVYFIMAYNLTMGKAAHLIKKITAVEYPIWNIILWIAIVLSMGLFIVQFTNTYSEKGSDTDAENFKLWNTAKTYTPHFIYIYDQQQKSFIDQQLDNSEKIYQRISDFFQYPFKHPIIVDMTSESSHYAGLAFWKKIKINKYQASLSGEFPGIFAHETTHVLIDLISDGAISSHFNEMRILHEGLATYIEHRFYQPAEKLDKLRSVTALMHAREKIKFTDLIDNAQFSKKWDTNLIYAYGERFVASIVEIYGDNAMTHILSTFNDAKKMRKLDGYKLWHHVMKKSGYSLTQITNHFYVQLNKDQQRYDIVKILAHKKLKAIINSEDEITQIQVTGDIPPNWTVICRLRSRHDTAYTEYTEVDAETDIDNVFNVYTDDYRQSFWYQIGLSENAGGRVVYEQWKEVFFE